MHMVICASNTVGMSIRTGHIVFRYNYTLTTTNIRSNQNETLDLMELNRDWIHSRSSQHYLILQESNDQDIFNYLS